MPYVVRAFPVLPTKESQVRQFAAEIAGPRNDQVGGFYANLGVNYESWHLQRSPQGDFVIVITEVDNPEARAEEYAVRDDGFTEWFKARVRSLCGIDPDTQPMGPPTEKLFEWSKGEQ